MEQWLVGLNEGAGEWFLCSHNDPAIRNLRLRVPVMLDVDKMGAWTTLCVVYPLV